MADQKVSSLTELTTLATGDFVPIVDVSDTSMAASGTTKKIKSAQFLNGMLAASGQYYGPPMPNTHQFTCLNEARYFPIRVGADGTLDRIAVAWGNVAGSATMTVRLAVYADSGGIPGAKLVEATAPAGQTDWTWLEMVISLAVTPGRYWLAVAQNGTGTAGQLAGSNWRGPEECHINNGAAWYSHILRQSGVTGALPDPATFDWQEDGSPMIAVRRA